MSQLISDRPSSFGIVIWIIAAGLRANLDATIVVRVLISIIGQMISSLTVNAVNDACSDVAEFSAIGSFFTIDFCLSGLLTGYGLIGN